MKPLFIGFYTTGTPYANEAAECIKSLESIGLDHEFVGVPNLGKWEWNCAIKPAVILRMMHKHVGRPLVYLDADARVHRYPTAFDVMPNGIDLACHFRNGTELLSGTLYIGTTEQARWLVGEWLAKCASQPDVWDQKHLQNALAAWPYKVHQLPAEYVRVFDDDTMGDAVILHGQASRRFQEAVKR